TSIVIKNKKNDSVNTLYYEEPFKIELEIQIYRNIKNAIIDFSIGTFENRVSYTSSFDIKKENIEFEDGKYKISVNLDPKLLPGQYSFYLGIHDMNGTGHTLDLVERIKIVTVLPITENNSSRYPLNVSLGTLRVDGNWEINKQND
ncbi:MAG: Wzt carbohydrate-binding domain-containing protein, partial [Bacteroidetes bacterium]|nr:Wzt carbohydrate-binding domain-containing protein [Bacteroidota bacterium]